MPSGRLVSNIVQMGRDLGYRVVIAGNHDNGPALDALLALEIAAADRPPYRDIATHAWNITVGAHTYAIGGNSNGEYFRAPRRIASELSDTTTECCNSYNMLKLTRQLFFTDPTRAAYLDYYERALYNQVLGSKQDEPDAEKPLVTYFIGLVPGHVRDYTPKAGTTCCEGTGMESATRYQDSVYFAQADGSALYVNLYLASTLRWPERGFVVEQTSGFPAEGDRCVFWYDNDRLEGGNFAFLNGPNPHFWIDNNREDTNAFDFQSGGNIRLFSVNPRGSNNITGSATAVTNTIGSGVTATATTAAVVLVGVMLYVELVWLPKTRFGRGLVIDAKIDGQSQPPPSEASGALTGPSTPRQREMGVRLRPRFEGAVGLPGPAGPGGLPCRVPGRPGAGTSA